jgi:hypothetical protein
MKVKAQGFPLKVEKGKLSYVSDAKGNRILDFSSCGYMNSQQDIPDMPVVLFVESKPGDNSPRIQKAIDYVSALPLKNGFRGAILLAKGTFELQSPLRISASGVLLQGSDREQTVLLKKGVDRGALIYIEGQNDVVGKDTISLSSSYVPVNSTEFDLANARSLTKGSRVFVVRPSTKEWIASLRCNEYGGGISALGWKPGEADLSWDRTITSVSGSRITLDAPLTAALDQKYGGAKIIAYQWKGRINQSGVSNICLMSEYDKSYPKDEDHCWNGIYIDNAENCWVQKVTFMHFAGSAVVLQPTTSKVTVEDCISLNPVSEIGGMRRSTFLTYGQQNLFQRCYSEHGIHDFAAGYAAPGPNAFVQCETSESYGFSGSVGAWACGLLFDIVNIDGHNITFKNLGQDKQGAGWNTANSLCWQCSAAEVECYKASPDAVNRGYGVWAQFSGDGDWAESNNHVQPRSFFYAQLTDRLGKDCTARARILPRSTEASSSPSVQAAQEMAIEAQKPRLTMVDWILSNRQEIEVPPGVRSVDDIEVKAKADHKKGGNHVQIVDGLITLNGNLLVGGDLSVPWWNGKLRPNYIQKAVPHLTRFVPGREGLGLTDRVDSVISYMQKNKLSILYHNYGLWYDRRRDDHERIRRRDGDVWGPFYEQPFARANTSETAWDGLSKYDLRRPNGWYWTRLKEYADKASDSGLLLFHANYFQHNIIEAGAHWVDSPWRSANNVNNTGFPEPVNFAGDKRVFMADFFYDVNHPTRRQLHRNYIRQCLNSFADNDNVVQLISEEYTGPLHFVEFWLDVIAEWEVETGKKAKVALSVTKDVQDAILRDERRSKIVDIIDIRYWHYKDDGTVYAPEGGKNLAPRQHARLTKVGKVTFREAYKAVSEYRAKYPDKAVTYYAQNYRAMAWAVLMAGGSCPALPVSDPSFLKAVAGMKTEETGADDYKKLVKSDTECVIFSLSKGVFPVNLTPGNYQVKYIDPSNGQLISLQKGWKLEKGSDYVSPTGRSGLYWFSKK